MASTESSFSFTTKIGGDLFTVRGDTVDEFISNMKAAIQGGSIDWVKALQEAIPNGTAHSPGRPATHTPAPAPQAAEQPTQNAAGIEVVTDKNGTKFTYGHPDAPDLPNGRGKYIQKGPWTTQKGDVKTAWVDPMWGPKPVKPSASKAETIWIN